MRSMDGGAKWTPILNGLNASAVLDLAVSPANSNQLLCAQGQRVFESRDQGNTWNASPRTAVGEVFEAESDVLRITVSPSDPVIAYAATEFGRVYRGDLGGDHSIWGERGAPEFRPPVGVIGALAVGWNNPDLIYIGYAGYRWDGVRVYCSRRGGETWSDASGSLGSEVPNSPVNSLVIDQYDSEIVYAATDVGVFRSHDGGMSWDSFDDDLPRVSITQLALRKASDTLYASTMGRGAYKRRL